MTKSAPLPGSQLRSVRVEWAAIVVGSLVSAAVFGIASAFVHVHDAATVIAALVGGSVGAGISIAVGRRLKSGPESRLRHPHVWPTGSLVESPKRAFIRTVLMMAAVEAAFVVVFVVSGNAEVVVYYAVINLVMGIAWTLRYRRVVRIETELQVGLYRALGRFPEWPSKPLYFARSDRAT